MFFSALFRHVCEGMEDEMALEKQLWTIRAGMVQRTISKRWFSIAKRRFQELLLLRDCLWASAHGSQSGTDDLPWCDFSLRNHSVCILRTTVGLTSCMVVDRGAETNDHITDYVRTQELSTILISDVC